jgi:hypothetical protein
MAANPLVRCDLGYPLPTNENISSYFQPFHFPASLDLMLKQLIIMGVRHR